MYIEDCYVKIFYENIFSCLLARILSYSKCHPLPSDTLNAYLRVSEAIVNVIKEMREDLEFRVVLARIVFLFLRFQNNIVHCYSIDLVWFYIGGRDFKLLYDYKRNIV